MSDPIRADRVKPEIVQWLWNGRIPRGMITTVAGRPDQGKGLFAAHVAAFVSRHGGKVLYSAAEDSASLMTRPRLEAAGANLDNILLWRFSLSQNGVELEQIVRNEKIDLIVMDPFAAHLGGKVSRHSDNIREVLNPLTSMIEETNTAVLIIEHALKRVPANGHILNAIGGSGSGLPAASRAAFVFGIDPDDEDKRVLAPAKFNIGPSPKALAFDVDTEDLDVVGDVPYLEVSGEMMAFDPMRLFADQKKGETKVGRPPEKRAQAAEWLTIYLAEHGAVAAGTVIEDAKQHGMSTKTLRRASEDIKIVKTPPGGGKNCVWDLSDETKSLMGIDGDDDQGPDAVADAMTDADAAEADDGMTLSDDDLGKLLGGS
jgi:putative DNA primase/helicase